VLSRVHLQESMGAMKSDKLFSTRYSIRYGAFFDTIRCVGLKKDLLFKEFSANFRSFRRISGIFGVVGVVVVVEDFGSWVFGIFREFSVNFLRKKDKKITNF